MIRFIQRTAAMIGLLTLVIFTTGWMEAQSSASSVPRGPKTFRLYSGGNYSAVLNNGEVIVNAEAVAQTALTGNSSVVLEFEVKEDSSVSGVFTIIAVNGVDRIFCTLTGSASGLAYGYINLSGTWTVTGGANKFLGTSGDGEFSAVLKPLQSTAEGSSGLLQATFDGDLTRVTK